VADQYAYLSSAFPLTQLLIERRAHGDRQAFNEHAITSQTGRIYSPLGGLRIVALVHCYGFDHPFRQELAVSVAGFVPKLVQNRKQFVAIPR
jgi:hypothetical protein